MADHLSGAHRRTMETILRHPTAHNLDWNDVVGLDGAIGHCTRKSDNDFEFEVAQEHLLLRKPHGKDLSGSEVMALRHFLQRAGATPAVSGSVAPDLMVVIDHHETRIFLVDVAAEQEAIIRPYDPHHFLHHLKHKDQSREQGQRAAEDPSYYERIAKAVVSGGGILVIGHGSGKSSAADHLVAYLREHHPETYRHVVTETELDLSAVTAPQLAEIARRQFGA